jgi:hypothetical protein
VDNLGRYRISVDGLRSLGLILILGVSLFLFVEKILINDQMILGTNTNSQSGMGRLLGNLF